MLHGHWVIEVKNPDGKLASHTEFENSLQPSGADALTGLVSGQYVSGGFQIVLSTSATPSVVIQAALGFAAPRNLHTSRFTDVLCGGITARPLWLPRASADR